MADEKEGVSYYFILNQKTSDTPVSLTLEYSVAGKSYAASISTFAKDNAFKEGTHQKYNIAVNGKEIQITGAQTIGFLVCGKRCWFDKFLRNLIECEIKLDCLCEI